MLATVGAVAALAVVPAAHAAAPVYNLAGRCFTLQAADGKFVAVASPSAYAEATAGAASFYFKATALGSYLLYDQSGGMLAPQNARVTVAGPSAEWKPWAIMNTSGTPVNLVW